MRAATMSKLESVQSTDGGPGYICIIEWIDIYWNRRRFALVKTRSFPTSGCLQVTMMQHYDLMRVEGP